MERCRRKCWKCKNVAIHEDSITPFVNCGKCGSQDTRLVYPAIEESHPECPHCGREFDPPPIVDGERYPPVFARHVCDCGYNFESERVVRYISRPMEERK